MRIYATICALLLGASLAHAGPADDCNQVRDLNRQFRGCTAYIKQGSGDPQNLATAYLNRANIYARRGKYPPAFQDYAAAISLDPQNLLVHYNRGNAYFDIKEYGHAVADYTLAIKLDARFALAYLNRGLAHEKVGDAAAAAEDYRHVLELDPTVDVARERLKRMQSH